MDTHLHKGERRGKGLRGSDAHARAGRKRNEREERLKWRKAQVEIARIRQNVDVMGFLLEEELTFVAFLGSLSSHADVKDRFYLEVQRYFG